eukprot:278191-Chlamydomonas_euryale.AAC.5
MVSRLRRGPANVGAQRQPHSAGTSQGQGAVARGDACRRRRRRIGGAGQASQPPEPREAAACLSRYATHRHSLPRLPPFGTVN